MSDPVTVALRRKPRLLESGRWWADGVSEPPGYVRPHVYTEPRGPDARVQRITRNVLERMHSSL